MEIEDNPRWRREMLGKEFEGMYGIWMKVS